MKKICVQCKTENDSDFSYCKRCGAVLPVVEERANIDAEVVFESSHNSRFEETSIDGVSGEHLKAYIGKNHSRIMDSFYNMSIYGKKTSFCAPVLILGLLSGFFGMSIWFFYRKMNKIGFLLLSIPLIFSLLEIVFNLDVITTLLKSYSELFSSYIVDAEAFNAQLNLILNDFNQNFNSFLPEIRNLIEGIVAPIAMSVFALYFYKNKAVKSVKAISQESRNDSNLSLRLFLSGGTSAARIIIPFAVVFAFSMALMVLATALII